MYRWCRLWPQGNSHQRGKGRRKLFFLPLMLGGIAEERGPRLEVQTWESTPPPHSLQPWGWCQLIPKILIRVLGEIPGQVSRSNGVLLPRIRLSSGVGLWAAQDCLHHNGWQRRVQSQAQTRNHTVTTSKGPVDRVCANILPSASTCTLRTGRRDCQVRERQGVLVGNWTLNGLNSYFKEDIQYP